MSDIICVSHLRWDFVWQRPQQLLSRLSKQFRVFFIEEPVASPFYDEPVLGTYTWHGYHDEEVTVVRMHQPMSEPRWVGHGDPLTSDVYNQLLRDFARKKGIDNPILWLYTPMASSFIKELDPQLLVYDVMDQLSAFKGAPLEISQEDLALLQRADLVFTGGASLYRDKAPYNPNTHLFPSGVDVEHFCTEGYKVPPYDIASLSSPILGYFGVIDERLDGELLDYVAKCHPEWNIVMIGPVIKISPEDLPQSPNIHYLGMKSYTELPAYLAHFDVAIVPFARNDATRYVSPTKVLEYLAAHKPIVSTAIQDVIELYGNVVHVGHDCQGFVEQVEQVLRAPSTPERWANADKVLRQNTWDAIVRNMTQIIERAM
jgi:UDP-galactopyranose mutase